MMNSDIAFLLVVACDERFWCGGEDFIERNRSTRQLCAIIGHK